MMKTKKKQLIKGIMLSTVLGLGWIVAGDISQAAGHGLSQEEETPQWNEQALYKAGNIVSYEGIQYEAQDFSWGKQPSKTLRWRPLKREKKANKSYYSDAILSYYEGQWFLRK
ncbi:hypothetical protein CN553_16775 [Bacillus cereus]|uniref:Chitin-binding protein n=1 Tax=Bacillus cereus TaxID=1396 RepID=A0A9X6UAR6_BACCE|nr:hypothetical protein [Bacillus cereus]PEN95267.1 hypothetical protein CN553_16775 [Bacillus cereus]